jgi:ATP-dependent protease ClpP protease subunit
LERDNFMTATEAKTFGLIDEVVEKRVWDTTFSLCIQLKLDNFKH